MFKEMVGPKVAEMLAGKTDPDPDIVINAMSAHVGPGGRMAGVQMYLQMEVLAELRRMNSLLEKGLMRNPEGKKSARQSALGDLG